MKLIVGLGNPGKEYEETKHNIGFRVVDSFGLRHHVSISEKRGDAKTGRGCWTVQDRQVDYLLAKPQTFMNRSGQSVARLLEIFDIPLSDVILVVDDLDLECGQIRVRTRGRAGGHRGVASVIEAVGSDRFLRLKVGIGRNPRQDPSDYVLTPFSCSDKEKILEGVKNGVETLGLLLCGEVSKAMNRFHRHG